MLKRIMTTWSRRLAVATITTMVAMMNTFAGDDNKLREEALKEFGILKPVLVAATQRPEVSLGQALFWDARLSADGKTACASCHLPADWGADRRRFSPDAKGKNTARNSQTVFNSTLQPSHRRPQVRRASGGEIAKRVDGIGLR